jgi:hypothetical protein
VRSVKNRQSVGGREGGREGEDCRLQASAKLFRARFRTPHPGEKGLRWPRCARGTREEVPPEGRKGRGVGGSQGGSGKRGRETERLAAKEISSVNGDNPYPGSNDGGMDGGVVSSRGKGQREEESSGRKGGTTLSCFPSGGFIMASSYYRRIHRHDANLRQETKTDLTIPECMARGRGARRGSQSSQSSSSSQDAAIRQEELITDLSLHRYR